MNSENNPDFADKLDSLLMSDELLPITFKGYLSDYIALAASLPAELSGINCRLQANLLLAAKEFEASEARQFIQETDILFEEVMSNMDDADACPHITNIALMTQLDNYMKSQLGDRWISEADHEYFKPVYYQNVDNTVVTQIVSEDNFYFKPPLEKICAEDTFPPSGKITPTHGEEARRELIGKNVSVFKPDGSKVFWGDLQHADIKELGGTYYVLSQRSSYFDVPNYAILFEESSPADDPNRPEGALVHLMPNDKSRLSVTYVRVHCIGAIVEGNYEVHKQSADVNS